MQSYRAIPLFVWHRQNWNVVYPHVTLDRETEMAELNKLGTYVAGFLDPAVQARTDLYDLFVSGKWQETSKLKLFSQNF